MNELDIDLSSHHSKHLSEFQDQGFDLVITVCDSAKESCPTFPGARETLHWPFDDPADATGTTDEQLVFFRRVRDEIRHRIRGFLG
jgi:arsenate reductase